MSGVGSASVLENNKWITSEEDFPTPTVLPRVPLWHILVRPVSVKRVTQGGIVLPDDYIDELGYLQNVARIVKIGELAYKDETFKDLKDLPKVGDFVVIGQHVGTKLYYKGIKMLLIDEKMVLMIINDPKDLDKHYKPEKVEKSLTPELGATISKPKFK